MHVRVLSVGVRREADEEGQVTVEVYACTEQDYISTTLFQGLCLSLRCYLWSDDSLLHISQTTSSAENQSRTQSRCAWPCCGPPPPKEEASRCLRIAPACIAVRVT